MTAWDPLLNELDHDLLAATRGVPLADFECRAHGEVYCDVCLASCEEQFRPWCPRCRELAGRDDIRCPRCRCNLYLDVEPAATRRAVAADEARPGRAVRRPR